MYINYIYSPQPPLLQPKQSQLSLPSLIGEIIQFLRYHHGPYWMLSLCPCLSCGEEKERMTLDLLAALYPMQTRISFPFFFLSGHFVGSYSTLSGPQGPLLSSCFPQHFFLCMELFLPRYRSFYFPLFNFMRFLRAHFFNLLKSLWSTIHSSLFCVISKLDQLHQPGHQIRIKEVCLKMCFWMNCSITFPGNKMRLLGLQFPGLFFFPFLKIGITFAFLQLVFLPVNDQRLPGLASQWYLPALSALVGASCQDPWTHVQFTFMFTNLILFWQGCIFLSSTFLLLFGNGIPEGWLW